MNGALDVPVAAPAAVAVSALDGERSGLTSEEADRRRQKYGANEPVPKSRQSLARQIFGRLANPLVAILLISSGVSAALGDLVNSSMVLAIVFLSMVVEFVQTHRSAHAAQALEARVTQTATVFRDGKWRELPRRDVVPGDTIRLSAGDMVAADADLVQAKDLHVNEAALTGESLPVEKSAGAAVLMGASIVSGFGVATVSRTGAETAFGGIAKSLAARPPPSEFERGIVRFGVFISKTVVFLLLFVLLVSVRMGRDPLQSLLFAVALAVGLTPEFLPMITTVTLTKGAVRMAREKVIVKNLAAIQNLGSMDVLCSDKTGTLTTGTMRLERAVDPLGTDAERPLLYGAINSCFESGVDSPVDAALLQRAKVNSLDAAVLEHEHPDISGFVKVDEIPFDFERRRVSVVAARGAETLLVTKGAPEEVLAVCSAYDAATGKEPLTDDVRRRSKEVFEQMSAAGYRVLAVAYTDARLAKPGSFTTADEHDLVLAGFLAFVDPPRDDAGAVLSKLYLAGVQVKVLTGDSDLVARHVCGRVGVETTRMLLGTAIEKMSDAALLYEAERTHVFARVSPSQKNRILNALKARGHVVGFLGDGINDAPSLHAADVGISVSSAVDVAKEAADVILLEPGLNVLLAGVMEGRRAFGNVMKYLLMGTSSSFGNMFSMAAASAFLPFLPMLPGQILLNNFLYDAAQITIPSDNVDVDFVRKPRRWDISLIRRFMLFLGPVSSLYDFLTFFVLIRWFHASEALFHTGWFIESLATQTLVIFVIRTGASALRSRPSLALRITTLTAVGVGVLVPFLPLGAWFGFVAPPPSYLIFVALATATYLLLVRVLKRRVLGRALG